MNALGQTDYDIRKKLFEEIKKMNRTEQEELYRILKSCDEEVSENKNGIFFDLMNLQQSTVDKIQEWISFCSKNKIQFELREKALQELEKEITVE
jgi:hypothetical protein